jgi:mannose-6-phosphate isomerase
MDFTEGVTKDYSNLDSFVIHVCVEGAYTITHETETYDVKMGECILLPNTVDQIIITTASGFKILESYIQ